MKIQVPWMGILVWCLGLVGCVQTVYEPSPRPPRPTCEAHATHLRTFTGHTAPVWDVVFSPDGLTGVSGGADMTVKLWDLSTGECLRTFAGHAGVVTSVVISPDGSTLASSSYDGTVKLWDIASGECLFTFAGHEGAVKMATFSPDGHTVLSASDDAMVKLWDVATGECVRTFKGHKGSVECVAFSPDGATMLSGGYDFRVRIWDVETGRRLKTFIQEEEPSWVSPFVVSYAFFTPDGRSIISGYQNDTVLREWDIARGRQSRIFAHGLGLLRAVTMSPDGRHLLIGNEYGTFSLLDIESDRLLSRSSIHPGGFGDGPLASALAFSPDGRRALSNGIDGTVMLWDLTATE
jgi:WD40 repeat protein